MSYLYGEEDYSSIKRDGVELLNSKTKNTLDQMRLGMQAGYVMGFMPYAAISYANNLRRTSDIGKDYLGRDTFIATAGLNFFSASNRLSGGIFYSQELNRKHSDNDTISANINFPLRIKGPGQAHECHALAKEGRRAKGEGCWYGFSSCARKNRFCFC